MYEIEKIFLELYALLQSQHADTDLLKENNCQSEGKKHVHHSIYFKTYLKKTNRVVHSTPGTAYHGHGH